MDGFTTKLGRRCASILQHLFPPPLEKVPLAKRPRLQLRYFLLCEGYFAQKMTGYHFDTTSMRYWKKCGLVEVGCVQGNNFQLSLFLLISKRLLPSVCIAGGATFELRLFQVKLATLDSSHAENEFVYRPYQHTAKRKRLL